MALLFVLTQGIETSFCQDSPRLINVSIYQLAFYHEITSAKHHAIEKCANAVPDVISYKVLRAMYFPVKQLCLHINNYFWGLICGQINTIINCNRFVFLFCSYTLASKGAPRPSEV